MSLKARRSRKKVAFLKEELEARVEIFEAWLSQGARALDRLQEGSATLSIFSRPKSERNAGSSQAIENPTRPSGPTQRPDPQPGKALGYRRQKPRCREISSSSISGKGP
jgi:hypothetical protein